MCYGSVFFGVSPTMQAVAVDISIPELQVHTPGTEQKV